MKMHLTPFCKFQRSRACCPVPLSLDVYRLRTAGHPKTFSCLIGGFFQVNNSKGVAISPVGVVTFLTGRTLCKTAAYLTA